MGITREYLNGLYLHSGSGIEIGAGYNPWPKKPGVQIKYVDKFTKKELQEQYRDQEPTLMRDPDVVDNGQDLKKIEDESLDFILSSHQLEHCLSPLTALSNHLRVLRVGGVILYALPNKDHTFDRPRRVTEFAHLMEDYELDLQGKLTEDHILAHFDEYYEIVDQVSNKEERMRRARLTLKKGGDVHYHCWDAMAFYEFFYFAQDIIEKPYEMELFHKNGSELFVVLRKKRYGLQKKE